MKFNLLPDHLYRYPASSADNCIRSYLVNLTKITKQPRGVVEPNRKLDQEIILGAQSEVTTSTGESEGVSLRRRTHERSVTVLPVRKATIEHVKERA